MMYNYLCDTLASYKLPSDSYVSSQNRVHLRISGKKKPTSLDEGPESMTILSIAAII